MISSNLTIISLDREEKKLGKRIFSDKKKVFKALVGANFLLKLKESFKKKISYEWSKKNFEAKQT